MSVADYMSMQKRAYASMAATREGAEKAVHPSYAVASRQAYPTLAFVLGDYAQRTGTYACGTDIESIRQELHPVSKQIRILDFGCGVGRLMEALVANGFSVDGVDISAEMLGFARASSSLEAGGCQFFLSTGNDCGEAPSEHYDLAFSALCFQHICVRSVRNGILAALRRCLKPEGVFSIQLQYFPGIAVGDIPGGHAGWMHDKTDVTATNSAHDVWLTSDMLPNLLTDFETFFSDVQLQFVHLPGTRFEDAGGRTGAFQHLFISGSKTSGLRHRLYRA